MLTEDPFMLKIIWNPYLFLLKFRIFYFEHIYSHNQIFGKVYFLFSIFQILVRAKTLFVLILINNSLLYTGYVSGFYPVMFISNTIHNIVISSSHKSSKWLFIILLYCYTNVFFTFFLILVCIHAKLQKII